MPPEQTPDQAGHHDNPIETSSVGQMLDDGVEDILDEDVDLEEYAAKGVQPPLAKGYKIKVNKKEIVVQKPKVTGREVLTIAGLLPAADYTLRLKRPGLKPEKVGLDEVINLRTAGVEKFKALPKDQTEG